MIANWERAGMGTEVELGHHLGGQGGGTGSDPGRSAFLFVSKETEAQTGKVGG